MCGSIHPSLSHVCVCACMCVSIFISRLTLHRARQLFPSHPQSNFCSRACTHTHTGAQSHIQSVPRKPYHKTYNKGEGKSTTSSLLSHRGRLGENNPRRLDPSAAVCLRVQSGLRQQSLWRCVVCTCLYSGNPCDLDVVTAGEASPSCWSRDVARVTTLVQR